MENVKRHFSSSGAGGYGCMSIAKIPFVIFSPWEYKVMVLMGFNCHGLYMGSSIGAGAEISDVVYDFKHKKYEKIRRPITKDPRQLARPTGGQVAIHSPSTSTSLR